LLSAHQAQRGVLGKPRSKEGYCSTVAEAYSAAV
jgi:hypothetical protein